MSLVKNAKNALLVSTVPASWIRLRAPSANKVTTKKKLAKHLVSLVFLVSIKAKLVRHHALRVLLTKRVRVLLPLNVNHAESVKSLMKVAPNVPNVMLARQELESMVRVRYANLVSIVTPQ